MRGLYDIPTRMRRSTWYAVDGELRVLGEPGDIRPPPFPPMSIEFRPRQSSKWICFVDESRSPATHKIGEELRGYTHCRALLRWVERVGAEGEWDIVVSPNDAWTVSLTQLIERLTGHDGIRSAVRALQLHVEPIPWPLWIPNDEKARLVPDPPPSDVDAHVWVRVCAAVSDSFGLESDQATWSVDMDQLAMDSLDWVILTISLEQYLSIDLTEDESFELSEQSTIGAIYRFLIRIKGDQLHASK